MVMLYGHIVEFYVLVIFFITNLVLHVYFYVFISLLTTRLSSMYIQAPSFVNTLCLYNVTVAQISSEYISLNSFNK